MSIAALVAAALAAQAGAAEEDLIPFYQCEAVRDTAGGQVRLESTLRPDGRYGGGHGLTFARVKPGQPKLEFRWNFLGSEQRVYAAYVSVTVPLRRKLPQRQLLRLNRIGSDRHRMALSGPATTSGGKRPQALAFVDLDTLLAYAADSTHLTWEVGPPFGEARDSGALDLAPLRAIVGAFGPLLDELKVKQASYKTQCSYREEPPQPHAW